MLVLSTIVVFIIFSAMGGFDFMMNRFNDFFGFILAILSILVAGGAIGILLEKMFKQDPNADITYKRYSSSTTDKSAPGTYTSLEAMSYDCRGNSVKFNRELSREKTINCKADTIKEKSDEYGTYYEMYACGCLFEFGSSEYAKLLNVRAGDNITIRLGHNESQGSLIRFTNCQLV